MNKQATSQVRNGVKAPQRGFCRVAWDAFDSANGKPILCAHMPQLADVTGLNVENLRIELRRWKRFNGVQTGARA